MARIVGGSILGFLSGKMAGMVFSHNKVGQYIRQYVIPVDPATTAQIQARSSFGNKASAWHSLTDLQKGLWNGYANTIYNPKHGSNVGQFSGINTYVASNNVIDMFNSKIADSVTVSLDGVSLGALTPEPYINTDVPPINPFPANLGDDFASGTANMVLVNDLAQVTPTGEWNLQIQLDLEQTDLESFTNSFGDDIGWAVYRSGGFNQINQFVENPYLQMLRTIPAGTWATEGTGSLIRLKVESSISGDDFKSFPSVGEYCQLSLYAVSKLGQLTKVGAVKCQVVSTLSA